MTTTIRLTTSEELLASIPIGLGFVPRHSLVVLCFQGKRELVTMRYDLPSRADVGALAGHIDTFVRRHAVTAVFMATFDATDALSMTLLDAVEQKVARAGLGLIDRLAVRDGRWWRHCTCCARQAPQPVPGMAEVPALAEYVGMGSTVLPDRDALREIFADVGRGSGSARHVTEYALQIMVAAAIWATEHQEHTGEDIGEDTAQDTGDDIGEDSGQAVESRGDGPGAGVPEGVAALLGPPGTSLVPGAFGQLRPSRTMSEERGVRPYEALVAQTMQAWELLLDTAADLDRDPRDPDPRTLLNPTLLASLVGGLRDRNVRDAVIEWLCPGQFPGASFPEPIAGALRAQASSRHEVGSDDWLLERERIFERLVRLARQAPAEHVAPVLAVIGVVCWYEGDGAKASMATEEALRREPDLYLAQLIEQMIRHGLRPHGIGEHLRTRAVDRCEPHALEPREEGPLDAA